MLQFHSVTAATDFSLKLVFSPVAGTATVVRPEERLDGWELSSGRKYKVTLGED